MNQQEFWSAVIALALPPLLYLLRTVIDEAAREDAPSYRWGGKQRRADVPVHPCCSHEFLLVVVCLADLAILKTLL